MSRSKCLILIPAYNEEKNIGRVMREIRGARILEDILVINDGSADKTASIVEEAGERVVSLPYNLGYGGALQTGFKYAAGKGYKYVIQFDADGQHDPKDLEVILELLETGKPDIVIGSRFMGRSSFYTGILKKLAIGVFRFLIKFSTGVRITDPTSGLQGLSQRAYRHYAVLGNYPEDFPDADTLIYMILSGYRVEEFPANIRERHSGKSMHSGFRILYYFIKMLVSIFVVLLRKKTRVEGVESGVNS